MRRTCSVIELTVLNVHAIVACVRQCASALLVVAACVLPAIAEAEATDPAHVELPASGSGPLLVLFAGAYYPSTSLIHDPKAFLASPVVSVPTLVLAGVLDTYMSCCTIERARARARRQRG